LEPALKILVVYPKFHPREKAGSDVYLLGLCRGLADLGHEITLATTAAAEFIQVEAFSLRWLNDYDTELDNHVGFRILRFPVYEQIPDYLRKPAASFILRQWENEDIRDGTLQPHSPRFPEFSLRQAGTQSAIIDWLHGYTIGPNSSPMRSYLFRHARDYDCVIGGFFPFRTLGLASLAARKAGRPCFIAPLFHSGDRSHYFKHLFRALQDCSGVICETRHAKEVFERLIPGISCVQAGIGVRQDHLSFPRGRMPSWITDLRNKSKRILLYVGRKEESKNYLLLIEILRCLADPSITLVMIGKDVDGKPPDYPNVLVLDQVNDDELQWAYHFCDIFLFPSLRESFGIVILEAWAARKPVIGHSRCAAVSSLIQHNFNGMLCESREQWLAAVKHLIDNQSHSTSLGNNGRNTLLSQYTWQIVTQKVNDFICAHSRIIST
jgi:glycosyltransferase involved in cell wall biosynthesis